VAKPKKLPPPAVADASQVVAQSDQPRIKWSVIAQIAVGVIIVWALALGTIPYISYWGVGVVAVLTAVLAGFGIWIWRFTRRQQRIVDVLRQATDEPGRLAAIAQLEAQGSKDAMASLARAQLVLRDDPRAAMEILEGIQLAKEPGPVQDEVRSNLAFLYLAQGRPKDARPLVDELRLDRQQNAKAKAMYAAVMAETFARTGKPEEAKKLLETYSADDPAYGEVAVVLLRAQVYTFSATKNRGLMRKAMIRIAESDPNQLAPFMAKGASPELQAAVREVLSQAGFATRAKQKVQRR
jgi:tetratricopeptide (TPR) repeat protein